MALAIENQGSQTTVLNTDHVLDTPTTNKTRLLVLDLVNLGFDAVLRVTVEISARDGANLTRRPYLREEFRGGRTDPIAVTTPVPSYAGARFIIRQVAGTVGSVPWAIVTMD